MSGHDQITTPPRRSSAAAWRSPPAAADDGGKPASGASRQDKASKALLKFASCMREHGIDMPDPQFATARAASTLSRRRQGERQRPEDGVRAEQACAEVQADRRRREHRSRRSRRSSSRPRWRTRGACASTGIDMPDPSSDGGTGRPAGPEEPAAGNGLVNPDSPKFQAAERRASTLGDRRPGAHGAADERRRRRWAPPPRRAPALAGRGLAGVAASRRLLARGDARRRRRQRPVPPAPPPSSAATWSTARRRRDARLRRHRARWPPRARGHPHRACATRATSSRAGRSLMSIDAKAAAWSCTARCRRGATSRRGWPTARTSASSSATCGRSATTPATVDDDWTRRRPPRSSDFQARSRPRPQTGRSRAARSCSAPAPARVGEAQRRGRRSGAPRRAGRRAVLDRARSSPSTLDAEPPARSHARATRVTVDLPDGRDGRAGGSPSVGTVATAGEQRRRRRRSTSRSR